MIGEDTALLMIDIQNDFCPAGALAVDDGDAIIPIVNRLQSLFHVRILTQDWHPHHHSSFADNHEAAEPFSVRKMHYGDQVLWPRHCVQGDHGAQFHDQLKTHDVDLIVRKGFRPSIDSYSAFFENDRKTRTGLAGYLKERDVRSIYVAGLATDFCVYYSIMDALDLGFDAVLITDACRAIDLDGSLDIAMAAMKARGAKFTTSEKI